MPHPIPLLFEQPHDFIPLPHPNRVDVVNVPAVGGFKRRHDFFQPLKKLIVLSGVGAAPLICLIEVTQLDSQNCRLDAVHSAVPAHHRMVVFSNLAVIPQNPDLLLQFIIVCHDSAGLAKCAEVLARIKAEATGIAD